ncbi:hypothetical protein BDY21DRAFT_339151 [Lineolata rhizophorae]|uniref:Phospholipid/glycerol acyltransferase domain-containing protein n=1 Tax=Lineolata rhizophorae TaxID=578093 RepID=A0A6A6P4G5_9PEZI|nr:hypothetical protein BDY21DRAFT_339151 [Lineolata rhizophorae]
MAPPSDNDDRPPRSSSSSSPLSSTPLSPSPPPTAPDLSILGDQVTIHPTGYTETPLATQQHEQAAQEQNLVAHMARFRESPLHFLREISLHVSGTGWRSYDRVVGQPVFYAGFSERMRGLVLASPTLRRKVKELAERRVRVEEKEGLLGVVVGMEEECQEGGPGWRVGRMDADESVSGSGNESGKGGKGSDREDLKASRERRKAQIERSLLEVTEKMTDDMICKMESKRFIRGAYYLCTQLLTRAYHQGIHVSSEEVLRLRSVAEEAAAKKQSIIFLPCHRSHVDYVSLQIICYRLGLALPTVVAGDNLNFPLVGPFLQYAGAMWIRRSFGNDQLYTTLVQAYMDTLLQNGYNVECFVEGGRSRTGKLLQPKFGILGFLLDSVMSGRVDDAIVCCVSTQYDKVLEVDSYISELLGQPKPKENLRDFLSASSILSLQLGRVDVRFHEPWSLRGFINQQRARLQPNSAGISPRASLSNNPVDPETRTRVLRTLGYKVLSDINAVSVVMPTALIGTVLLTLRGRGVGRSELIRRVEWLGDRVKSQGGRVAHFAGLPTSVVVERGLEVLGPELVGLVQGLAEPTYYAVDRFQLSFYRNMTIHLFILQSLVSAGLYTRVKQGGGPEHQSISYEGLLDQVSFLSQLFRGEFIFPTEGLVANLDKTLRGLEVDGVITVTRERGAAAPGGSEEGGKVVAVGLSDAERETGRENFDFYCFLIWPFIEASWLGAVSLMMLTPPVAKDGVEAQVWLDAKKVQEKAQLLGKTLYHQGDLSYFEAVNKETLKNAYTRFEEEGIVVVAKGGGGRSAGTAAAVGAADAKESAKAAGGDKIRLAADWAPTRDPSTGRIVAHGSKLWDFAEMISQSRREGKNRRDGATVQNRVLSLVDVVGGQLFEEAARAESRALEERRQEEGGSDEMVEAGRRARRRRKRIQERARL